MNLTTYNKLMKGTGVKVHPPEWKMFLELVDVYLKRHKVKEPRVIEVGLLPEFKRHEFYEQLFSAKCVDSLSSKERVNILTVEGGEYQDVNQVFKTGFPLTTDIFVIFGLESCRYKNRKSEQTWKFWEDLKHHVSKGDDKLKDCTFVTIHSKRMRGNQRGIGVIFKK